MGYKTDTDFDYQWSQTVYCMYNTSIFSSVICMFVTFAHFLIMVFILFHVVLGV